MGEKLVAITTQVDAVLGEGRDASDDGRARAFRVRLAAAQVVAAAHAAAPGLTVTCTVLQHAGALFRNLNDVDAVMLFATGGPTAAAARPTAATAAGRGAHSAPSGWFPAVYLS